MNIHPTSEEGRICPCGAVISEDERGDLCAKCRSRARWMRRSEGRRSHSKYEARHAGGSRRDGGQS